MAAESSTAATTSRSGGGGASPDSYIGSLISLTSKSEIRYEGILYNINTEESSIGLRNVRSFGTEGRKKDGPQVPPSDKIYEYILFRGSDIKDLQVKSSPPIPTSPAVNSDPAIIQSHYPRPTTLPTNLPAAPSGSLPDLGSHSAQAGLPGATFQGGLPLYQPGAHMNSWGPSPSNVNGSGLAMQMYWPEFYGTPNGIPQLPQQSLFRPPPGLPIPPSIQQVPFSGFNTSLPQPASSLPSSSIPDYHSPSIPNVGISSSLTSTTLPSSTLSMNVPPMQPAMLPSGTIMNPLQNKAPVAAIPTAIPNSSFQSLTQFSTSVPVSVGVPLVANKPNAPGPVVLPQQIVSHPVTSVDGLSASALNETPTPSLITPGQLLQPIPASSAPQPLQTAQKDVEVVQASPKPSAEPPAPSVNEAQPPILPLPQNTRAHKINGGAYHMRNNYRGRGGRGYGTPRPVAKFTEDFDFMAMNERFKKDEVWGHLGKSNKSQLKDKEDGSDGDEEDLHDDGDSELPKIEIKPVYKKDDFFDSLSCNSLDNDTNYGRTRYSEQMKLDTETFGDFSRYWGARGGRGPGRGGGRFRGSYYGRGYGGYGRGASGRGRGAPNRAS